MKKEKQFPHNCFWKQIVFTFFQKEIAQFPVVNIVANENNFHVLNFWLLAMLIIKKTWQYPASCGQCSQQLSSTVLPRLKIANICCKSTRVIIVTHLIFLNLPEYSYINLKLHAKLLTLVIGTFNKVAENF